MKLDLAVAREAILAYNNDAAVQRQERAAAVVLGSGFVKGRVLQQLRGLDKAFSTRSVSADIEIISARIERGFESWSAIVSAAAPLVESVVDSSLLRTLVAMFLDAGPRRRPRSLLTKALHFAAPQSFIPADSYATNTLGHLLDAGSWADTNGLDTDGMTLWFHDYLSVVHAIGVANGEHTRELLRLDEQSATESHHGRARGWPKILDKMLWWLGRPGSQQRALFLA